MSNSHANIMGLNTGVFFSRINETSPQKSFFSKVIFKPEPIHYLRALYYLTVCLCFLALAMTSSQAQAKETLSKDIDSLYSGFSDNWSGAYLGASLGYGWGNSRTTYDRDGNDHLTPETAEPSGYLGSLTLGYNYQLGNNIVVGIEGDIGIMDVDANDRIDMWDGHVWKSQFGGMWGTLRGRLGYAFDNTLIYGTGGLAFMETAETILGDNDATQNTYNEGVHTGWVLGGGIEYALSSNVTTKVEYLHMEFPKHTGYTNNEELYSFKNDVDLVRVGLNYKF